MQLFNGLRGTGKTEALIRYAYKNMALILCCSQMHCNIIKKRAIDLDMNILEPMVFSDYFDNVRNRGSYLDKTQRQFEIVVDELDLCLQKYLGDKISVATGTIPTTHPQDHIATYNHSGHYDR